MDYIHSELVDPTTYDSEGLCEGISLRNHSNTSSEEKGISRAQRDWSRYIVPIESYHGGRGSKFSFVSVTLPECLPERLEIISYANEYAFLYDDVMEQIEVTQHDEASTSLLGDLYKKPQKLDFSVYESGAKQLRQQILTEMMAIDKERAITSMKAWMTFVQLASSRDRSEPFSSFEEYLPYRVVDVGEIYWFGAVTFGLALTIPENEMELCKQLTRPAFAAISLTNDLYSWEKEYQEAQCKGLPHVMNAIWVLMNELSVSDAEAKEICRIKIKQYVSQYCDIMREVKLDESISADLKKYVEALQYSISGHLVWSIYCPRLGYQTSTKRVSSKRSRDSYETDSSLSERDESYER